MIAHGLRLFTATVVFLFSGVSFGLSQESWVVVREGNDPHFSQTYLSEKAKEFLVLGKVVIARREGSSVRVMHPESHTFDMKTLRRCQSGELPRSVKKKFQRCLNKLGFDAGPVDGDLGARTQRATRQFLKENNIDWDIGAECLPTLICFQVDKTYRIKKDIEYTFSARKCDRLDKFSAEMLSWRTKKKCEDLKVRDRLIGDFNSALSQLKCDQAKQISQEMGEGSYKVSLCYRKQQAESQRISRAIMAKKIDAARILHRNGACDQLSDFPEEVLAKYSVKKCKDAKERKTLNGLLDQSLTRGECDEAESYAAKLGSRFSEIADCRATVQRKSDESAFAAALVAQDCVAVKRLEQALGKSGNFESCEFNAALSLGTARKMFLAAARYDAQNQKAKAKALYLEVMDRFQEDDLALQAATRLTTLNDLERSEQARVDMEAELARLQQQADAAKRAAERERKKQALKAQRQAERRAEIDRNHAECAHLTIGRDFWMGFLKQSGYVVYVDRDGGRVGIKHNLGTEEFNCYQIKR